MLVQFKRFVYNFMPSNVGMNHIFADQMHGHAYGTLSEERAAAIDELRQRGAIPPIFGEATTWYHYMVGIHANQEDHIRSTVTDMLDVFLADYLRVNEAACG